ncbi:hypothetical protein SAMN06273570_0062 [Candidatus Pantoea floridensis]|uniref:Uncharacterized protein n=1 Tax=Candidatus Pantoea floridensis TaxID=1938870 RepID=A0A286BLK2_9GAMM|nr:hypothetical protein BX596_1739 [Enterobacteriaceae bacterium JKS000233]SOD35028.1 hypothetical protein SAMN06273570_0062 [Pantoea floridensis]
MLNGDLEALFPDINCFCAVFWNITLKYVIYTNYFIVYAHNVSTID